MGSQTSISQCAKTCEGMLEAPQRQKYSQELQIKENSKSQKSKKTQIYKSRLITDQEIYNRSSPAFDLISEYLAQDYRYTLPEIKFLSGTVYVGEWVQEKMDGQGKLFGGDGMILQGQFKKGKVDGKAKIQFPDGDVYQGEWVQNKAHGFGVYKHNSGALYEGYWYKNMQNGIGIETWADNSRYEGSYINGKKHGEGKYTWADGSYYKGSWKNNKIQGYGQYIWSNGRSYKGHWKENQMHGKGIHQWEDGRKYEGNYVYDKKQGQGKYYWPDGKKFEGKWVNGKREGVGKIISESGQVKIGLWQDDKKVKWLTEEEVEEYSNPKKYRSRSLSKVSNDFQNTNRSRKKSAEYLDMGKNASNLQYLENSQHPNRAMKNNESNLKTSERVERQSFKKGRKIFQ